MSQVRGFTIQFNVQRKDLGGKLQFSAYAVDAAGNKSKAKKASIKVTPLADKTGDALTEFLPDSTGSVDLLNDDLKNKGNGFNGTPA